VYDLLFLSRGLPLSFIHVAAAAGQDPGRLKYYRQRRTEC